MNHEDGHFKEWFVVYKEENCELEGSARDSIVWIEFVCVETCRRVGEPEGSWPSK